jgi:uncharacterized protein
MLNIMEVHETNQMIEQEKLDVRTITMGISLLDCASDDLATLRTNIYQKITSYAKNLVSTGEAIEREYGIPIVNKRITVTPISLVAASACSSVDDYVQIAHTLDKVAKEVGVNFIGGYSALVSKSMTPTERLLIESLPQALSETERVCASVNVGSTKTGIDMDAVALVGRKILEVSQATADTDSSGNSKLVIFCNAPDDNPFMAGGFHGVTEGDAVINVGVSGPGVVRTALESARGKDFGVLCETIKRTAFKITRVGQLVAQEASKRLGVPFGIIDLSLAPTPAVGGFGRRSARRDGLGTGRCSRNDRRAGPAQRSGQEGRHHGIQLCGRTLRRLHPCIRGQEHDRCRSIGLPDHRETGSDDLCVQRRSRHDRDSRRHHRQHHLRHHRR